MFAGPIGRLMPACDDGRGGLRLRRLFHFPSSLIEPCVSISGIRPNASRRPVHGTTVEPAAVCAITVNFANLASRTGGGRL
jgi:hypothetical protein